MLIYNHCATAIAVNSYILTVALLENDTLVTAAAARQSGNVASTITADIFIILAVAAVIGLINPGGAILQPHIYSTAIIHNTTQVRILIGQGNINSTGAQSKDIATKLNSIAAYNIAILPSIDVNRSLIRTQGIITIAHTLRYVNFTTANGYSTACSISCDTIAVYVHIRSTADVHAAIFYLRQNTGVIKTRQYIILIQRDAPSLAVCTLDSQITVNCNAVFYVGGIACFTPTVSLLYSHAIAAVSAHHTNVDITIDRNLAGTFLASIVHNGVV